jgi:hypothetical protein
MNCRQGDLAVIVHSVAGNEGKVVQCLRAVMARVRKADGSRLIGVCWEVDRHLPAFDGTSTNIVPDSYLRPLRNGPGMDETLCWAGLPSPAQQETAK